MRAGHGCCTTSDAFSATVEEVGNIDRESLAENLFGGVEQLWSEPFIPPQEDAPMSSMVFEFFPMKPNTAACPGIARLEHLVATGMSQGEQTTQTSPTLGGLD
jgi:hypothetical protein